MSMRKRSYSKVRRPRGFSKGTRRQFKRNTTSSVSRKFSAGFNRGRIVRGAEFKVVDTMFSGTSNLQLIPSNVDPANVFSSAGNGAFLNKLVLGPEASKRIGNKVTGISLRLQLSFIYQGLTAPNTAYANPTGLYPTRFAVVYDRSPTGGTSLPSWDDVFRLVDSSGSSQSSWLSVPNVGNRDRFIILLDEFCQPRGIAADANTALGTTITQTGWLSKASDHSYVVDRYVKLNKLESVWRNNASTDTDYVQGSIFIIIMTPYGVIQPPLASPNAHQTMAFALHGCSRYVYQDV